VGGGLGSLHHITAMFGLTIAGLVVKDILVVIDEKMS
jgi:tRNA A37 threonylcarbamoyladenosine dehydratase